MDRQGFEALRKVVESGFGLEVTPEPGPNESLQHIDIVSDKPDLPVANIMNAIRHASVNEGAVGLAGLRIAGTKNHRLTLEDSRF